MWETSSGGRRVRKSRASVGVRTEWRVRRTGRGEWRRRVRRKCDWRGGGRAEKWLRREGRVRRVVRERSGCIGDGEPGDGHMGGSGEPLGDGRGDGGAAAVVVGTGAARTFLRGGSGLE